MSTLAIVLSLALLMYLAYRGVTVLLLAPVLAAISIGQRGGGGAAAGKQPLVPLFVVGFLAAVGIRSLGVLPPPVLQLASLLQTGLLAAAMFALGTSLHLSVLRRAGVRPVLLGLIATVVVGGLGLLTCRFA